MVALATTSGKTAADIGCDHGLLTCGLAATGRFDYVVGVDVSQKALDQGGLALLLQLQDELVGLGSNKNKNSNINFLVGDGLKPLQEADTICVAGMGVHSMKEILSPDELERVGCQQIVIQPHTSTRPRSMMMLYHHLVQNCGFAVDQEHISFLSQRWYLSASFQKTTTIVTNDDDDDDDVIAITIPGQALKVHSSEEQRCIYDAYVAHHVAWLKLDGAQTDLDPNDILWLNNAMKTWTTDNMD